MTRRGNFNRDIPAAFQSLVKPDEEVIVICWQGHGSAAIANMLAEQGGYTKVYNVTEEFPGWNPRDRNPRDSIPISRPRK